ncbi:Bug family tripartite tricarboxylate transporter substrate binding protein [Pigmentiphaga litoralis]|uniref:Tripartite-type tricarboxylate transporter receptor subunit TctC n=1 Tax=Pigmentiphaga litoralis TaxID=516702 RepID=A0A7Y9IUD6_9BURK|nr:tripartite tricarboxylate transporter substrate binding protein [Pigmentiphaga litoralis]NYE23159.1 tripartite-type tricarboxylate transporter receptor subunit TctC [Pigmentiphaga litoralis]NYE83226.1 tripartite-type tricarboxylate transporter receptor subunit TctC [Pigmentiphaga litoralis]
MTHTVVTAARTVLFATLSLTFAAQVSASDTYPSRPIRVVVPVAAGGWGDASTRIVAQRMAEELGQPVVVENRTGAGGLLGIRHTKAEAPDGYTLMSTGGTIAIQQALSNDPGYDTLKDFTAVGSMVRSPAIVVTSAASPYKTMPELIAAARANPQKISYGSAGVGTTTHIAAEMLLRKAGVKMMHVPYKGNGAAMPDVIAGRVSFMIDAYGSSASNIGGGRLRALGVTSDTPMNALPNVPVVASEGVPGFKYYYWLGLFAPAGVPPDVVAKLSGALKKALSDPKIEARLQSDGTENAFMAPAEFSTFLRKEVAETASLINDLGLPKE